MTGTPHPLLAHLLRHPLIAILRGVAPAEVESVAAVLLDCGFRVLEVPLNSPDPLASIARLAKLAAAPGSDTLVGAGTVLTAADVDAAADAGARLILAPNTHPLVLARARERGLLVMPGVATPSEAFMALEAGASALKMFPADVLGPASVRAWRAVLPAAVPLFAVGGIDADNMAAYRRAGASGAGIGSALYRPGVAADELRRRAMHVIAAWPAAAG